MLAFIAATVAGSNPSEAYSASYSVQNMLPATIASTAYKLLQRHDISTMIMDQRAALVADAGVSQASLVKEYLKAALAEVDDPVTWTEKHKALDSLAKLLGYLVDRKEVDLRVYGRFVIGTGYGEPEEPTVVEGKVVDVDAGGRLESRH